MGRHFVFGLSSCPKSLYPQLVLQIQYKYKYFLFPKKDLPHYTTGQKDRPKTNFFHHDTTGQKDRPKTNILPNDTTEQYKIIKSRQNNSGL
jgi:hypothetical protein